MPVAAPRHCPHGHAAFTGRRCTACADLYKARAEAHRPNARQRGYDSKWSKESKAFLALPGNDRCACGCGLAADMVDHKTAPKGDMRLFWDRSNWQPMNHDCNRRKAIASEGAFGRKATKMGGHQNFDHEGQDRPSLLARNFVEIGSFFG